MQRQSTSRPRAIGFAVLAACIYGLVPIVARLAYDNGIPALESVVVRTLLVAVVLGAMALLWKQRLYVERSARWPFVLQVLATMLVSSSYIGSLQFIPVGVAVLVFFTFPVLVSIVAPLMEGQRLSVLPIGLALLAFAGLALALGRDLHNFDWRGLLLAGFAAVGCALQFISGRMMSGKMLPAPFAALVHLAVLPVVLLIMVITGDGTVKLFEATTTHWAFLMVALVGILYCAAYFCHMSSVSNAPAAIVAPYFNIEPVVSTLVAVLLLGERITYFHMIGGCMILTAVLISSRQELGVRR